MTTDIDKLNSEKNPDNTKPTIAYVPETPPKTSRKTIADYFNSKPKPSGTGVNRIPETPETKKILSSMNSINDDDSGTPNIFKTSLIHNHKTHLPIRKQLSSSSSSLDSNEKDQESESHSSSLIDQSSNKNKNFSISNELRKRFAFQAKRKQFPTLSDRNPFQRKSTSFYPSESNLQNIIPVRPTSPFRNPNLKKDKILVVKESPKNLSSNGYVRPRTSLIALDDSDSMDDDNSSPIKKRINVNYISSSSTSSSPKSMSMSTSSIHFNNNSSHNSTTTSTTSDFSSVLKTKKKSIPRLDNSDSEDDDEDDDDDEDEVIELGTHKEDTENTSTKYFEMNNENPRMNAYTMILSDMFPKKSKKEIIEAFSAANFNLKKASEILKNNKSSSRSRLRRNSNSSSSNNDDSIDVDNYKGDSEKRNNSQTNYSILYSSSSSSSTTKYPVQKRRLYKKSADDIIDDDDNENEDFITKNIKSYKKSISQKRRNRRIDDDDDDDDEEEEESNEGSDSDSDYKTPKRRRFNSRTNSVTVSSDSDNENPTLEFFNKADPQEIQDIISICTLEQANIIISLRPFRSIPHLKRALNKEKGISGKLVEHYEEVINGYNAADTIIENCEKIGKELVGIFSQWGVDTEGNPLPNHKEVMNNGLLKHQPNIISKTFQLKNYQLLGVSWLTHMYKKGYSGILADEMGLGKTAQVISFLGNLYEKYNEKGPHLIIVPSSTKDNWLREFEEWCPTIPVRSYYGSQAERYELRNELRKTKNTYSVILTTYQIASSQKEDRAFLKHMKFKIMILDEGHMMKNMTSMRYKHLMAIKSKTRFLLTGTPIQNNLQELITLLTFIMPKLFLMDESNLRKVFEIKSGNAAFLSSQRVARAKKIMEPFVLRRKKKNVLKELPKKFEKVVYCEPTERQKKLYEEILKESKKKIQNKDDNSSEESKNEKEKNNGKSNNNNNQMNNILMELRKLSDHPLLIRRLYTDDKLLPMSKAITNEEQFCESDPKYVFEDMQYLSDFELHTYCVNYKHLNKYKLIKDNWMDSGKIKKLQEILKECKARNDKILLFSQFTKMLDILETVMSTLNYSYLRLDGSTPVSTRQEMIDQYNNDENIFMFLLSTKAGGFGINLTAANTVIIYDLDFNPHNDKQAEDRAHRVGQKRDVTVIKMITKNTIEENILEISNKKLKLDVKISNEENPIKEKDRVKALSGEITSSIPSPSPSASTIVDNDDETNNTIDPSIFDIIRTQVLN